MASGEWVSTSLPYLVPGGAGSGDAWAAEAASKGARGTQRVTFAGEVDPPPDVGGLLGGPEGAAVVLRQRLVYLDEAPVETVSSYFPLRVARGTRLAEPSRIRGGAVALLEELGYAAVRVQEDVTARPPVAEERATFALADHDPVLLLTRLIFDAQDRPFQVDVLVTPASLRRYRYELRIR